MPFAEADRARIHWDERGTGTPILLVMGHTYASSMWYPVLDDLSEQHRLIWFDNRGTGDTPLTGTVSVASMVADALAVLDAAGVDQAHVYGVSMGGGIALELARVAPHRVTSLLLGCTTAKTPDAPGIPWFLWPLMYLPPALVKRIVRGAPPEQPYGSAAGEEAIARDLVELERNICSSRAIGAQARAIARYSIDPDEVRAMRIPALVLHGDEDAVVRYEAGLALHELLPDSELVTLPGAGHNYFVAHRATANEAVLRFLARVDHAEADEAVRT